MILLFTDFGWNGPYVGQVKLCLVESGARGPLLDLMHDVPSFDVRAAAHLLVALRAQQRGEAVWLTVVDPGVGGARRAVAMEAGGRFWVGPDNGLWTFILEETPARRAWVLPVPASAAPSFHGRDVFAPAAALLSRGSVGPDWEAIDPAELVHAPWPRDWPAVIYVDAFDNACTGLRAEALPPSASLRVGGTPLVRARTFSEVPLGAGFWYVNSLGLVEVAVNQGSAAARFGLRPGSPVEIVV